WTATHVFLFGILQYFYYNKRQAYFWIFISILFHFSFTFPVAIFLIWKILPRWPIVYFLIFIGTAFLQEIDFQVVKDFLRLLPEIFQGKVNSYYGEEYLENFENGTDKLALHFVIYGWLRKLFLYLWIVISYLFII